MELAARFRITALIISVGVAIIVGVSVCACAADLDLIYSDGDAAPVNDAAIDPDGARQKVRESQIEAGASPDPLVVGDSGGLPCSAEAGLSEDGCDEGAGNGCCLRTAAEAICISQSERCGSPAEKTVFVACRQSRPDDMCCWRNLPGGGRGAFYSGACDGGTIACLDDAGCADFGLACTTTSCAPTGFVIGQCGNTAPPCPGSF